MTKSDSEKIADLTQKVNSMSKKINAIEKFIEKEGLSKNGRLVHCDGIDKKTNEPCDHSWITRSKMKFVSCPKCGKKVKIS